MASASTRAIIRLLKYNLWKSINYFNVHIVASKPSKHLRKSKLHSNSCFRSRHNLHKTKKKENTYIYPSAFICSASERIFKLLAREARRLFDSLHDELVSTCLLFFHSWKQFLAHSRSTSQKNGFFLVMNEGLVQNNSSKLVNMLDIKLIYIVHVPIRVIQALHVSPSWLTSIIVSW